MYTKAKVVLKSTHLRKRLKELSFLVVGTSLTLDGSLRTPRKEFLSCLGMEARRPLLFLRWFKLFERVNFPDSKSSPWIGDTSSWLLDIVVLDAFVFTMVGIGVWSPSNFSHGEARSSSEIVSKLLGPTDEQVLSDILITGKDKERSTTDTYRALRHFGFLVSWQHFTRIIISICKS